MTKAEIIEKIKAVKESPSCYSELKTIIDNYLGAVGRDGEHDAAKKLLAALDDCVSDIDNVVAFMKSDKAKSIFGAEGAAANLKKAEEAKAAGSKICFCPACQNGEIVLENKDVLLA